MGVMMKDLNAEPYLPKSLNLTPLPRTRRRVYRCPGYEAHHETSSFLFLSRSEQAILVVFFCISIKPRLMY